MFYCSNHNAQQDKQILELENQIRQAESETSTELTQNLQLSTQLNEIQSNNEYQCRQLNQCFSTQIPPLFITQMPLNEYYQKGKILSTSIKAHLADNFKIQVSIYCVNFQSILNLLVVKG